MQALHYFLMELQKVGIHKGALEVVKNRELDVTMLKTKSTRGDIFGKMYDREKKKLDTLMKPPPKVRTHKPTEETLIKDAGSNNYQLALIHMMLVNFRKASGEKKLLLEKSLQHITMAQENEFAMSKQKQEQHISIVKKTIDTIMLKTNVASYVVKYEFMFGSDFVIYGKSKSVGINVTADDNTIVGTGVRMGQSESIVLTGLDPNNDYRFSIQKLDKYGAPLEKLSKVSQDVSTYFPLPVMMCFSYLAQTAFANECFEIAKRAANCILKPYLHYNHHSVRFLSIFMHGSQFGNTILGSLSKLILRRYKPCLPYCW